MIMADLVALTVLPQIFSLQRQSTLLSLVCTQHIGLMEFLVEGRDCLFLLLP